ncbi:MAG TPA: alkylmercury lyase [Chloroflexota bacterium]|jgi:hypothetical protein
MIIELLQVQGCRNVDAARELLEGCLRELVLELPVVERVGNFASPTILIDGLDVMGRHDVLGAACRLDLPTRDRVLAALREAT